MSVEHAYAYARPSQATITPTGADLDLATSGGAAAHPRLFRGELQAPAVHAAAILAVARTARTRFFEHGKVITDPVVTAQPGYLRFEALSSCAGVYARHDALLTDADVLAQGVTNVDVNESTRAVLARVGSGDWLHLDVGEEDVQFASGTQVAVERKVDLPTRWVKGFGEAGVAASRLTPGFELPGPLAQRFLRASFPKDRHVRLTPQGRWSATQGVRIADPERLKLLEPLGRFATSLKVYEGTTGVSAVTLTLKDAGHFTLILSPAKSRGFSGEGASLELLAHATLDFDALAARGLAGYDLQAGSFFERELPYDLEQIEALHPRLKAARELVPHVKWEGDHAWVGDYRVAPPACTCEWWGRYRGERGPCKHVLAAELARG